MPPLDPAIAAAVRQRWDAKTKPLGSLGQLEALALQVAQIQGREAPAIGSTHVFVFAADHGAARAGVSAYPQDVTWQMVMNFLAGGAAISVLARELGCSLSVVDAGVNHDFEPAPGLVDAKIAHGTASYLEAAAMSAGQCRAALAAGRALALESPADCLLLGEMGIGNTASASLLMHHLTGVALAECVGPGTGLDAAGVARKLELLERASRRHGLGRGDADALAVLATFGGFEIAMLAGCLIGAAQARKVVLVDGFIVGAAALVACRLAPGLERHLVFAHRSAEPAHRRLLAELGARPLLQLDMRLGEGSGAAVALPLLRLSLSLLANMATFESAQVSRAS
ncbi:MAG: nicotinate-nucleotide--dimethylbenzimidazole phosphoribosyltransferase [Burkholderiales bacterium]|nr:nicotinate-nucleotide--dimethylbenzimidazole phosphoribosyltransferase [Burkholderiales bacterium]MDE2396210.1 nicotinate-nucleotide--dimethylbenzimidazole phosphoribosyltransferase [Burkholderiales bacterium]MDE2455196.1 nicotinate-nucleotide--dimethylbenzimidazole phosphoribosyltransferase [Burkholderiales bacterium]